MSRGEILGQPIVRRWRGTIDVPLDSVGKTQAVNLGYEMGDLDIVYHDHLSRCKDTAYRLPAFVRESTDGPRPWRMGHLFDGRPITEESLNLARYYIVNNLAAVPPGGESFARWAFHWRTWIDSLKCGYAAVGVVTHNRNIQFLYACQYGPFHYPIYDVSGPDFCTVHVYDRGHIAPWGGVNVPRGIYLIRHGRTSFGT